MSKYLDIDINSLAWVCPECGQENGWTRKDELPNEVYCKHCNHAFPASQPFKIRFKGETKDAEVPM